MQAGSAHRQSPEESRSVCAFFCVGSQEADAPSPRVMWRVRPSHPSHRMGKVMDPSPSRHKGTAMARLGWKDTPSIGCRKRLGHGVRQWAWETLPENPIKIVLSGQKGTLMNGSAPVFQGDVIML